MQVKVYPSEPKGEVTVPSSKSIAHRALICAALSDSVSTISNINYSKDIEATIECLRAFGAKIEKQEDACIVTGTDITQLTGEITCDCGESGSTLRFLIPVAGMSRARVTFITHGQLSKRPMKIYEDIFNEQNLFYQQEGNQITIQGPLACKDYVVEGNVSSQFISGLLMGLSLGSKTSTITVIGPYESKSYVDLTIQSLKEFNIHISRDDRTYHIPISGYKSKDFTVEDDWSQAAFFAVLAAINGKIRCPHMNPDSLQGDKVILQILKNSGALIENNCITHKRLKPQTIDLQDCPDLGPILFVLAAYTEGITKIIHCGRLRIKESDRIQAMETELKKWGVQIKSTEDTVIIEGKSFYQMDEIINIDGHNDHRIVMAMTVFGLCAKSPCVITGAQAISKSYPNFFEDIQKVNGAIEYIEKNGGIV